MLTQLIWISGIAFEALLVVRSLREGLIKLYPLFYTYITFVLLVSLIRFFYFRVQPDSYQKLYWYTEFGSVLAGYGVIFEIYKRTLKNHPGVAQFAQNSLLLFLLATITLVAGDTFRSPHGSWAYGTAKLGRDLRYVELALWVLMLVLFSLYRIPAGRNLKGLIVGYGFFIALSVVNLAFVFQPENPLAPLARKVPSVAYLITLMIWCGALWRLHPEPLAPAEDQIERDYQALAARTRTTVARAMNFLKRSLRP